MRTHITFQPKSFVTDCNNALLDDAAFARAVAVATTYPHMAVAYARPQVEGLVQALSRFRIHPQIRNRLVQALQQTSRPRIGAEFEAYANARTALAR
jgi:hypothetical protein